MTLLLKFFNKQVHKRGILGLLLSLFLLAACNSEEVTTFDNSVTASTPNKFLEFFNQNKLLPSGQYTLVVATSSSGQSGTFSLSIVPGDGSERQDINGSWSNSAGTSIDPGNTCSGDPSNSCFDLDMQTSDGVKITASSTNDLVLYLVDDSDTAVIVAEVNDTSSGEEVIEFAASDVNQEQFATAYYQAVDPGNARDTLQKYKTLHGFDGASDVVHVIFRDSKDLGYGRDMYMRSYPNTECGGQVIAFYVQNFSVEIVDGLAYGPVNLSAAIDQDLQHHFGTNAIEFSRGLISAGDTCSSTPYNRFYTYRSDYSSPTAEHPRLLTVDLDGRGQKAVPQPCITCHGGEVKLLDRFKRLTAQSATDPADQIGDTKAKLQAFEVDTFEFAGSGEHVKTLAEENLRKMNSAIFCSYPGSLGNAACTDFGGGIATQSNNGEWNADYTREILQGWYDNQLDVAGTTFDKSFVPSGWVPSAGIVPEGADTLFVKVIAPNCLVCHGRQGNNLGANSNIPAIGKEIDFSSYQKFISYAEDIRRLVFEDGRMPMSLLNFSNFWADPEKAELLASFIAPQVSDFIDKHVDSDGNIIPPGKVVARAGLDRVTKIDAAIRLNGYASVFADSYEWTVLSQPTGANVTFSQSEKGATDFSADVDGSYEIQLEASSSESEQSDTDSLIITVDSGLAKNPRSLTFYSDVLPRLTTCANSCHSLAGGAEGGIVADITVWWSGDSQQPVAVPLADTDTPSLGLYEQVRSRINFDNIEFSPLLRKPTGNHHYGGTRGGFDSSQVAGTPSRNDYDLFINWIAEGAVCGGNATQCP